MFCSSLYRPRATGAALVGLTLRHETPRRERFAQERLSCVEITSGNLRVEKCDVESRYGTGVTVVGPDAGECLVFVFLYFLCFLCFLCFLLVLLLLLVHSTSESSSQFDLPPFNIIYLTGPSVSAPTQCPPSSRAQCTTAPAKAFTLWTAQRCAYSLLSSFFFLVLVSLCCLFQSLSSPNPQALLLLFCV